eukprot:4422762-Heterocapsa_arctica.AAC.1
MDGGVLGSTRTWEAGSKAPNGLLALAGGGWGTGAVKAPGPGGAMPSDPKGLGLGVDGGKDFEAGAGFQVS